MPNVSQRLRSSYDERTVRHANAYEEAILATGLGVFNVLVMLMVFLGVLSLTFASTTLSLIIPNADCQMNLTAQEKGYLNSITYIGMLTSVLFWAVISDYSGRKKVLISAHFLSAVFVLAASTSQVIWPLLVFKFFDGFCISGGFSALITYISEVHSRRFRQRIIYLSGLLLSIATVILPVIAGGILPLTISWDSKHMHYRSWNLFIAVTALPSLLCSILAMLLPESPKYLFSQSNYEGAAQSLERIYAWNTFGKKGAYPIAIQKEKIKEDEPKQFKELLVYTLRRMKPLFDGEYIWLVLCVVFIEFFVLLCQNTLRLWLPEIFARYATYGNDEAYFCTIMKNDLKITMVQQCNYVLTAGSYLNIFWVHFASILSYIFTFVIVNYVGAKIVLCASLLISCITGFILYFVAGQISAVIVLSIYLAMESIGGTSLAFVCTSYFPTKIRNTVLALSFFFGRCGGVLGNLTLYLLVGRYCLIPICCFAIAPFRNCLPPFNIPTQSINDHIYLTSYAYFGCLTANGVFFAMRMYCSSSCQTWLKEYKEHVNKII